MIHLYLCMSKSLAPRDFGTCAHYACARHVKDHGGTINEARDALFREAKGWPRWPRSGARATHCSTQAPPPRPLSAPYRQRGDPRRRRARRLFFRSRLGSISCFACNQRPPRPSRRPQDSNDPRVTAPMSTAGLGPRPGPPGRPETGEPPGLRQGVALFPRSRRPAWSPGIQADGGGHPRDTHPGGVVSSPPHGGRI